MILSCPACQTRFKVDPALLGPDGRKVRCAQCAKVWRVTREGKPAPTGQFTLRAPTPSAAQTAAAEAPAGAAPTESSDQSATSVDRGVGATSQTPFSSPAAPEISEEMAKAEAPAQPASADKDTPPGDAGAAATSARSTAAETQAALAAAKARPRKRGAKLKISLLLLALVVLGVIAFAVVTGRLGPGGLMPVTELPSTGEVAPPASDPDPDGGT